MRDGAPDEVMASVYRWRTVIQSWSPMGDLLSDDVPIIDGSISWDVAARAVHEQVSITVPRYTAVGGRRFDWMPGADVAHPLATFGQTLTIAVVITSTVTGEEWVTPLARVRVQAWEEDEEGTVQVTCVGRLQAAVDDVLQVPQSPDEEATLVSEFARLLPDTLSVTVDDAVVDRAALPGTQWAGSKLDALYDIADAIPARLRMDADGDVQLLPTLPDAPEPEGVYRDGEPRGQAGMPTLISAPRSDTRDGIVNSVTVLSQHSQDGGAAASVMVEQTTGPFAVATYGRVTESWTSEQIESAEQALAAGRERLAAGLRPARTVQMQVAPDPRVEPDDALTALRDGVERIGYVLAVSLDLLGKTAMSITLSIASERAVRPDLNSEYAYGTGAFGDDAYGF
ncbi:hypothetical protein [Isoptericola sp. NPDC055881]